MRKENLKTDTFLTPVNSCWTIFLSCICPAPTQIPVKLELFLNLLEWQLMQRIWKSFWYRVGQDFIEHYVSTLTSNSSVFCLSPVNARLFTKSHAAEITSSVTKISAIISIVQCATYRSCHTMLSVMQCKYHVQETLKTFRTMSTIIFCWYVFISWSHGNMYCPLGQFPGFYLEIFAYLVRVMTTI